MPNFHVAIGDEVTFSKTVAEADVYMFAGITGDFAPMHVNEEYMKRSSYGRRIAHGVLMLGFMSTTSSMMIAQSNSADGDETPVSLGYDRVRFLQAVYINDTINVTYRIKSIDPERRRSNADVTVTNQDGETVAVAEHILKWVPNA
jgi:acyl dehydratase